MIREIILTTLSADKVPHLAPMGVHVLGEDSWAIMPFRPSKTLENLLETGVAVMNVCEDVRIFAGALTGRRNWPLLPALTIEGRRLEDALVHVEMKMERFEEDPVRPRCLMKALHVGMHAPFYGFNRAQSAVLEAAILVSRLDRLLPEKIKAEIAIHAIALEKTGGPREREAWAWLMQKISTQLGEI